jgi:hypothetical protein
MQAHSNREILSLPDSGLSTEMVVRKWLVAMGSLYAREITPLLIATWCEMLSPLTPGQAEQGFRELVKSWTFAHFPSPAAVLSQFKNATEKAFTLEAEGAWAKLLTWVEQNYYPDAGVTRGAPRLSAAIEHAARAAGGYAHIERCSREQLVWVRKTFLDAYKNVHETGQVEHLISNAEAKRILAGFAEVRALPAPSLGAEEAPAEWPDAREVRAVLNRVVEEKPIEAPSDEELAKRRARLLRQAEEWMVNHGAESELETVSVP